MSNLKIRNEIADISEEIENRIKEDEELSRIFHKFLPLESFTAEKFVEYFENEIKEGESKCYQLDDILLIETDGDAVFPLNAILQSVGVYVDLNLGMINIEDSLYAIDTLMESGRKKLRAYSKIMMISESTNSSLSKRQMISNSITCSIQDEMNEIRNQKKESVLLKKFVSKNYHNLKFTTKTSLSNHRPDLWVDINGESCPLEAKRGDFNKRALLQLQRYMNVYKSSVGIAVAKKLTVELPDNIIFYNIEG